MAATWNLLSTEEAARQLGVSVEAVRRYHHSGILAGRRQGRLLLIEQRAVLAMQKVIEQARTGKKPTPPRRAAGPVDQIAGNQPLEESENGNCDEVAGYPVCADDEDVTDDLERSAGVGEPGAWPGRS